MEDNEFIKNLEVVKNGVYGKDVRQAIYDLFASQKSVVSSLDSRVSSMIGYGNIITVVNPSELTLTGATYS